MRRVYLVQPGNILLSRHTELGSVLIAGSACNLVFFERAHELFHERERGGTVLLRGNLLGVSVQELHEISRLFVHHVLLRTEQWQLWKRLSVSGQRSELLHADFVLLRFSGVPQRIHCSDMHGRIYG